MKEIGKLAQSGSKRKSNKSKNLKSDAHVTVETLLSQITILVDARGIDQAVVLYVNNLLVIYYLF